MVRGSNPGGGRDFPHLFRPALGPPSLLYSEYWVFPRGEERSGCDADPSPLLVPWSRTGTAIPLSPYGPYGLYRASVPVQGFTLPALLVYPACGTYMSTTELHCSSVSSYFISTADDIGISNFFQSLHKVSQVFRLWFFTNNKGKKRIKVTMRYVRLTTVAMERQ
jgi:hypothetical protein